MATGDKKCPDDVAAALKRLWSQWHEPPNPQYVFMAMDLDSEIARPGSPTRLLIERITGMPTVVGNEVQAGDDDKDVHAAVRKKVSKAFLVLADITDDNLNTCIEAGIGLSAGARVELIARGKPRSPPFMLRGPQLNAYESDLERIGIVHRIVRNYRRRIINAEL
jgi:hypothetical protein